MLSSPSLFGHMRYSTTTATMMESERLEKCTVRSATWRRDSSFASRGARSGQMIEHELASFPVRVRQIVERQ